mmetsp:Transcript_22342/g.52176  ORF Transcript_22342/g.52176 Transcript_22342/m.52176 type:complete len:225 (+) Transcript_22342:560-1234(+)
MLPPRSRMTETSSSRRWPGMLGHFSTRRRSCGQTTASCGMLSKRTGDASSTPQSSCGTLAGMSCWQWTTIGELCSMRCRKCWQIEASPWLLCRTMGLRSSGLLPLSGRTGRLWHWQCRRIPTQGSGRPHLCVLTRRSLWPLSAPSGLSNSDQWTATWARHRRRSGPTRSLCSWQYRPTGVRCNTPAARCGRTAMWCLLRSAPAATLSSTRILCSRQTRTSFCGP